MWAMGLRDVLWGVLLRMFCSHSQWFIHWPFYLFFLIPSSCYLLPTSRVRWSIKVSHLQDSCHLGWIPLFLDVLMWDFILRGIKAVPCVSGVHMRFLGDLFTGFLILMMLPPVWVLSHHQTFCLTTLWSVEKWRLTGSNLVILMGYLLPFFANTTCSLVLKSWSTCCLVDYIISTQSLWESWGTVWWILIGSCRFESLWLGPFMLALGSWLIFNFRPFLIGIVRVEFELLYELCHIGRDVYLSLVLVVRCFWTLVCWVSWFPGVIFISLWKVVNALRYCRCHLLFLHPELPLLSWVSTLGPIMIWLTETLRVFWPFRTLLCTGRYSISSAIPWVKLCLSLAHVTKQFSLLWIRL